MPFILGNEYAYGSSILSIHVWSALFVFLDAAAVQYLIAKKMQRFLIIKSFLGLSANVVVNLILIPKWGAIGASIGTVVAYCFSGGVAYWLTSRTREIAFRQIQGILLPFSLVFGKVRSLR